MDVWTINNYLYLYLLRDLQGVLSFDHFTQTVFPCHLLHYHMQLKIMYSYQQTVLCVTGVCALPKEIGRCRAAWPRYYYNPASSQCEKFIYGGCRGNANNFHSQEACMEYCKPEPADDPDQDEREKWYKSVLGFI